MINGNSCKGIISKSQKFVASSADHTDIVELLSFSPTEVNLYVSIIIFTTGWPNLSPFGAYFTTLGSLPWFSADRVLEPIG